MINSKINKDLEYSSSSVLSGPTFSTTFTWKDDKFQLNTYLKYNSSSMLSGPTFNTTFICKDDKFKINEDLEYNSSSMLSGPTFNITFTCKDDKLKVNKDLEYNSSSELSGPIFNTKFTCKDDKLQIIKDLEYNPSSTMSGPMSVLADSTSCANFGRQFEHSISSFPTPDLLLTKKNTDSDGTICKTENISLSDEEHKIKHEQLSESALCNIAFASSNEGETITVQSSDVSENDVAGLPIASNSLKEETKGNELKKVKMYYADFCTKGLHVSSKKSGSVTRMKTEPQAIEHTSDLHNDRMKKDKDNFKSVMTPDSCDLHCHMKMESGKQSFNTIGDNFDKCDYKMELNQRKKNNERDRPLTYNVCEKNFVQRSIPIRCRRSHAEEMQFKCKDREMSFERNYEHIVQMRTHKEEISKCKECGKTFRHNSNLNVHMRTHTGEKPFKCNECGKTFRQSGNLREHRRTHTGEKPFKCNECEMSFGKAGSLNIHKRKHTGENPFQCNKCEKTFRYSGSIARHMRIHT